jgi:hypothetical protein
MRDYKMDGPGYSIRVPAQFELLIHDPQMGRAAFKLQPDFARSFQGLAGEIMGLLTGGRTPGADDTGAIVSVQPLTAADIPRVIQQQTLWTNPEFSGPAGAGIGLPRITAVGPVRREHRLGDTLYLRDLEGYNLVGTHLRLTHYIVQGRSAGVEGFILIGLAVWPKYVGSCLQLIGGIDVSGGAVGPATLQAVVDRARPDQIEYRFENRDGSTTALTTFPTVVHNHYVINVDQSIKAGNISGTGVVVGHHSISRVD